MTDHDQPLDDVTQVVPTAPPPATPESVTAPPLTPAPVSPVSTTSGGPKPSRGRWAAAIVAAAVVVAITAGIVYALVGRSPNATVMGYVPSGAVAYGEVRLDLPGDQRQAVGEFLSHFPGFADQSTLDSKLDEALDDLVKNATDGSQTFTKDIQPWFGGELAFSAGPLPAASSGGASGGKPDISNALALVSIKDATAAKAWFDAEFAKHGGSPTTQDYAGTTLTVFGGSDGPQLSFAIVDGKVAIAGPIDAVKAAIDTGGKSGFAADPNVSKALGSASGDHIGFVYVDLGAVLDWSDQLRSSLGNGSGSDGAAGLGQAMRQFVPAWSAYWMRVENDAVVLEATGAEPATALGPTTDRASDVAKHVPATTIALSVSHDTGKTLQQVLDLYKGQAALKDVTGAIDKGLGALGGADNAIGWIGDTGLVVNQSGTSIEGGVVILPTDAKAAASFFTSVKNLASLSGAAGVKFSEQDHGGTTINVATIDLAGLTGAGVQMFALPVDKIELAWAVTDDLVVIGTGPAFVGHVLDTTEGSSLAGTSRYKDLMGRVGNGTASVFVDIAAARGYIEGFAKSADPSALKSYESDVKPFLTPLDALVASRSVGGDVDRTTVIITVK